MLDRNSLPQANVKPDQIGPSSESLVSLVQRLGRPPDDVIDFWCNQLATAAIRHRRETGQTLPPVDLNRCSVTAGGRLVSLDFLTDSSGMDSGGERVPASDAAELDEISLAHLEQFRRALQQQADPQQQAGLQQHRVRQQPTSQHELLSAGVAEHHAGESAELPLAVSLQPVPSTVAANRRTRPRSHHRALRSKRRRSQLAIAALAAIVGAAVVWHMSGPEAEVSTETVAESTTVSPRPAGNSKEPPSQSDPHRNATDSLKQPAMLAPATDAAAPGGSSTDSVDAPGMIPLPGEAADELSRSVDLGQVGLQGDDATDSVADELSRSTDLGQAGLQGDDAKDSVPTAGTAAIELAPLDEVETDTVVFEQVPEDVSLQFRSETPLVLVAASTPASGWTVRENESDVDLARLFAGEPAEAEPTASNPAALRFRWTEAADGDPAARLLPHGRLVSSSGKIRYLRPVVRAEPLRLNLQQSDSRWTWDLAHPILPQGAKMSLQFVLPDGIGVGWIEPVDTISTRRTRGLAVLSETDGETVSVAVRFDIRCRRQLSLQLRYAGQLDPASPWRVLSTPMLESLAAQVTDRSVLIGSRSAQITTLYRRADRDEKRTLRPQRDALAEAADLLKKTSARIAELQSLVAKLESDARLQVSLSTDWSSADPSGGSPLRDRQILFTTTAQHH